MLIPPSTGGTGQDVVYASILDMTKMTAASSSGHTYAKNGVVEGQNNYECVNAQEAPVVISLDNKQNPYHHPSGVGIKNNLVCQPEMHQPTWISDQKEIEYAMDDNPLYMMRSKIITKPRGANTSPPHHYDYVNVGNV